MSPSLMSGSLRMRLGAVALALATLAAVVFAILNFQQQQLFTTPDDGVAWRTSAQGVVALRVAQRSPADQAGIRAGDQVVAVRGLEIHRATDVERALWRAGTWSRVPYRILRDGRVLDTAVITAPARGSWRTQGYLRLIAVLYLAIGLFIFIRRWNAPRAVHFYVFCLVSFVLYSFHYTGKLNSFDATISWANTAALLLQAALLVHFALAFPGRGRGIRPKLIAVYALPVALLGLQICVARGALGFAAGYRSRDRLDTLGLLYMSAYFLLAAAIFLGRYVQAPKGSLRQQLKWVTAGIFAGTVPFVALYVLPRAANLAVRPWMELSVFSLGLIPLCFGYAILRYRLMDVDVIFKRALAYTFATAGVFTIYLAGVALAAGLFHTRWPAELGLTGGLLLIVVTGLLFRPFHERVQERLDKLFYRDRLDYRRTLTEFGRALANEVRLETLLESALNRISQTLLVDRLAVFLESPRNPGEFLLSRSMGVHPGGRLDLCFLDPARPMAACGCLFFESGRAATEEPESVRRTIEALELNYFIPCRVRERTVAFLGLGKTVDGDYLSTEDVELLATMAGYLAVAIENARLYASLEQKAAQIERLKDFSENIIESLRIGVSTTDLEGRIESWNPQLEELLGVPRQEAIGRTVAEVFPRELAAEIEAGAAFDHASEIYKFQIEALEGRQLVVNASVAPLVGKEGTRLGRLILVDDITERVQLEEQAIQTEKLTSLGLLAAGVAHEVNTPLAVISNHIQMLAKQIPASDPRQKTIEKIVRQTFRASEIVNHLLNFSRTGAAEFSELDLNATLDEALSLVEHALKTARVEIMRSYAGDLPVVLGSATRLQQVFLNLFLNARDAMPSGGILEIRTAAENGSVEVEISDSGGGIPSEHLGRIFDPFFTTKRTGRGTGLGLSVSYGIIKEHAGKVDVRSAPGKGTSFRLEFPAVGKAVHA